MRDVQTTSDWLDRPVIEARRVARERHVGHRHQRRGEGFVDTFDASPSGKYARMARLATRAGARTGLWSRELDRLFVGWPLREGHAAEIHVLGAL
ncbi:MAG: hypothetical protein M3O50_03010 [Myxococcota bacterium]|nr:hypothetical protein [Myxococcota bacterium]